MKKETSKKQKEVVSKVDKKQLIVGMIILIVAILTLAYAFMTMNNKAGEEQAAVATPVVEEKAVVAKEPAAKEEPVAKAEEAKAEAPATEEKVAVEEKEKPHVSLTFTATAEKDVEYVISFTTEESPYFNGQNVVTQPIKKGTANYTVAFPVEKIVNFRLDMSIDAGKMRISNLKLIGSQEDDISNPMYYEMMGRIEVAQNNTFIINDKGLPTLIYRPDFRAPQVKEEPAKAEAKAEETAPKAEETKAAE